MLLQAKGQSQVLQKWTVRVYHVSLQFSSCEMSAAFFFLHFFFSQTLVKSWALSLCVESACSPCVCLGSFRVLRLSKSRLTDLCSWLSDPETGPYLFSPGRKEVMGRLLSWQAWPGCQFALQAEQNSRAQTAHWTSCGSAGESDSFSWHTAWQLEEGHHVRQGSSSTSGGTQQLLQAKCEVQILLTLTRSVHLQVHS